LTTVVTVASVCIERAVLKSAAASLRTLTALGSSAAGASAAAALPAQAARAISIAIMVRDDSTVISPQAQRGDGRGRRSSPRPGQRDANDLLVVPGVNVAVGEGGVCPDDLPAAGGFNRVDDVSPVDLLIPFGREVRQYEVSAVVEEDEPVSLGHHEGGAAVRL